MANGDRVTAILRMDVFNANFQNMKEATKLLETFKAKANEDFNKRLIEIQKETEDLNPKLRDEERVRRNEEAEWWRTRELYYFIYRLAIEFKMFPAGVVDYRPRGKERPRGSEGT